VRGGVALAVVAIAVVGVFASVGWSGRGASPAGGLIAFDAKPPGSGASEVFVADLGTGRARQLTDEGGYDPTWSPDGSQLAFERSNAGPCNSQACTQIWRVAADGSNEVPVTPANRRCESPAWSPNGDRIAYAEWRPSRGDALLASIYTRTIDGQVRRLTSAEGAFDSAPAWSPNGRRIVFERYRNTTGRYTLHVMNADGTNQHRLRRVKAGAFGPAWSPNGRRFAIWRIHGLYNNKTLVAVLNANGTRERTLIRNGGGPVWSPDGRSIAFIPDAQGLASSVIRIMRADGKARGTLFGGRFTEPGSLDWLRRR
jgi:Tol biopolymer transport system component